ncbi:MAG: heparinase II/III family protein [Rhodobiaceae bacterium]|nr:heparinase II/III family protein [Rhodobiaceae bacterium]
MSGIGRSRSAGKVAVGRTAALLGAALRHDLWRARARVLRSRPVSLAAGRGAAPLRIAPPDIRAADPAIAGEFYAGRYPLDGHVVTSVGGERPFDMPDTPADWRSALHGFSWLRHLRAAGSDVAAAKARSLVADWLDGGQYADPLAWGVETTARRVISWLSQAPMVLDGADDAFHARFLRSLAHQVMFLKQAGAGGPAGQPRLLAAIACAMASLCMSSKPVWRERAGRRLGAEIDRQVYRDGGHVSRDPSMVAEILLDLIPLRQTYLASSVDPPLRLMNAIERMMPMVRFFRHRDGMLARFNGTGASSTADLATLLAYDDSRGEPLRSAPHSGYQRLIGLGATVVMDTGLPPPAELSGHAHAGTLAFEFSSNAGPIIVNCGATHRLGSRWAEVCRATAAHSTATLNDTSSAHFASRPWIVERFGAAIVDGPHHVGAERADGRDYQETRASHDGYAGRFGIVHGRSIVLAEDGTRLDGADTFASSVSSEGAADARFAIRFHLHPGVQCSVTASGGLQLHIGRQVWQFLADGGVLTLEESVHVNGPEAPRRTQQIVLSGSCLQCPDVYWSFVRSDHRGAQPEGHAIEDAAMPGTEADAAAGHDTGADPEDRPSDH